MVRKVEHVLQLPEAEIRRLRRGAIDYFERHLRATSVVERLLRFPGDEVTLHVTAHEWPEQVQRDVFPATASRLKTARQSPTTRAA